MCALFDTKMESLVWRQKKGGQLDLDVFDTGQYGAVPRSTVHSKKAWAIESWLDTKWPSGQETDEERPDHNLEHRNQ